MRRLRHVALSLSLAVSLFGADAEVRDTKAAPGSPATAVASSTVAAVPPGLVANNHRCFVCHANYDFDEEVLVFSHAKANVGCVQCHGESTRHSADEDGLTPPDRMFPKGHIRFNCLGCHDWIKLVASDRAKLERTDLAEKPDHQSVLDGTAAKKLCTDCHGDHRLGHRTRVWDKKTGQLLRRDATPALLRSGG